MRGQGEKVKKNMNEIADITGTGRTAHIDD